MTRRSISGPCTRLLGLALATVLVAGCAFLSQVAGFCSSEGAEPRVEQETAPVPADAGPVGVLPMLAKVTIEPGKDCHRFYYSGSYEHHAFLSPDMPTYLPFGQTGSIRGPFPPIYLVIDVPPSVAILGGRFLPAERIAVSDVVRDGAPYRRYRLDFSYGRYAYRASVSQLVVTTTLLPGSTALAWYATEVAGWRVHERTLPLTSIAIPTVRPPTRLPVFLDTFAGAFTDHPDRLALGRLGFNMLGGLGQDAPGLVRAAALMGLEPMGWNTEEAHGDDDWRTLDRAGKTGGNICPTYRGRSLDAWLERGRALIDAGVLVHVYDPERHDGEAICFHPRDVRGFRKHLEARSPALAAEWRGEPDPARWSPAVLDAWARFKAASYADLFGWYAEQLRAYMRQRGVAGSLELFLYANPIGGPPATPGECGGENAALAASLRHLISDSLQDPRELDWVVTYYAPMIYLDVGGRFGRRIDLLELQRQLQCYRAYIRGTMKLVPALSAGYPFTAFASELPAEAMKYQVLEAFASGAQGVGIYHEGSLDGLRMRYFAEAMAQVVRAEDVFADGAVIPEARLADRQGHAFVKGVETGGRAVILVSEYSERPRMVGVWYGGQAAADVTDLKTGLLVARLDGTRREFDVALQPGGERARLFLVDPAPRGGTRLRAQPAGHLR